MVVAGTSMFLPSLQIWQCSNRLLRCRLAQYILFIVMLAHQPLHAQEVILEVGGGAVKNNYSLSWLTEREVAYQSPARKTIYFSAGVALEKRFELHLFYSLVQRPFIQFTVHECRCTFDMEGPKYNSVGLAFRYKPFHQWRLSPIVQAQYTYHRLERGEPFGFGYADSVNDYQYFISNTGPRSRFWINHGFHTISLSTGATYDFTDRLSGFLRLSAHGTISDSPMHMLILAFESTQSSLYEIIYHNGMQLESVFGLHFRLTRL